MITFFSSIGVSTAVCTLAVAMGKMLSDYYFYYLLLIVFVVTVSLVWVKHIADNNRNYNNNTNDNNRNNTSDVNKKTNKNCSIKIPRNRNQMNDENSKQESGAIGDRLKFVNRNARGNERKYQVSKKIIRTQICTKFKSHFHLGIFPNRNLNPS